MKQNVATTVLVYVILDLLTMGRKGRKRTNWRDRNIILR
jgi:hypothetical protein